MNRWYALLTPLTSKEKILAEIQKAGFKKRIPFFRDIITFHTTKSHLYMHSEDDSLMRGYALVKIEDKNVKDCVSAITISKVGRFLSSSKQGIPRPVPTEEVQKFKKNVESKKDNFEIGQHVTITSGIMSGMEGTIKKKTTTMVTVEIKLAKRSVLHRVDILSIVPAG